MSWHADYSDHVVVVTGVSGTQAIGHGIARAFVDAGARVMCQWRSNDSGLKALSAHAPQNVRGCQADLTSSAGIEKVLDEAEEWTGAVPTILVNNAGAYPVAPLLEVREDDFDTVVRSNLYSVHMCTQAFAKRLVEKERSGSVVNIGSIEAHQPASMHAHYCAAKAGVVMYTRVAAQELGKSNIRVNSVSPGFVHRPNVETTWPEGVQRFEQTAPLTRLGQPADIAAAVLFLSSNAAAWISGIDLAVDGGVLTNNSF